MNERKPRSYTYRIPLDDTAAMFRLRRFERKSEYFIHELSKREVPNWQATKNIGVVFYQSKESRGDQRGEFEGGTIPGLEQFRYSLEWKPTPETSLLEMKRGPDGGTKIRGEQFYGSDDPRIPSYVPVETTVPWTPGEVRAMFDGEPVPNRVDYGHKIPEIPADTARQMYRGLIETAKREGFEKCQREIREMEENCNHDHAVDTQDSHPSGYCEDCGKTWYDNEEMQAEIEESGGAIVGVV